MTLAHLLSSSWAPVSFSGTADWERCIGIAQFFLPGPKAKWMFRTRWICIENALLMPFVCSRIINGENEVRENSLRENCIFVSLSANFIKIQRHTNILDYRCSFFWGMVHTHLLVHRINSSSDDCGGKLKLVRLLSRLQYKILRVKIRNNWLIDMNNWLNWVNWVKMNNGDTN